MMRSLFLFLFLENDRLSSRAAQAQMSLVIEADDDVLKTSIRVDLSALEQVLFNLIDNACKYAASATDRRLHLHTGIKGTHTVFKVKDHGPGIAKKEIRRLFRPFCKSARDAAGSAPGVGLGLSLSRRLAREMGGDLFLDGNSPEGACFVLTLPLGRP